MRNPFLPLLTLALATLAPFLPAQDFDPFADLGGGGSTSTKSEVFSTSKAITPGQSFEVVLKLTHPEGWHSYYQNPGIGIPSERQIHPFLLREQSRLIGVMRGIGLHRAGSQITR